MFRSYRLLLATLICGFAAFGAGMSVPGIENFDKIDENVYRGAQPSQSGFEYLAKLGVKRVINLREADGRSRNEERMVTAAGMQYINVPMTGLTPPTDAEITRLLTLMSDTTAGPVFVHCRKGADRTGVVIGAYRVDHDRWDNQKALKEAKEHGIGFFQLPRRSYIMSFRPRTIEATAKPDAGAAGSDATPAAAAAVAKN